MVNDYSSVSKATLWYNVKWPVIIFQHAALLEVNINIKFVFVHKKLTIIITDIPCCDWFS